MDAFEIEEGACGPGSARYAAGTITLPDGSLRGVEEIARIALRDDADGSTSVSRRTRSLAGSVRKALGTARTAPLPLRLALSSLRAGLGVIEDELQPREAQIHEIGFRDGGLIVARMPLETAALIRHDIETVRAASARASTIGSVALPEPSATSEAADEALTSIFRYEKRNGRLRRVLGKPEA